MSKTTPSEQHYDSDTIVAQATPPGRGGIGVVRVSGPLVTTIAESLLGECPKPRQVFYGDFCDKKHTLIDQGIALYFKQPQ